MITTSSRPTPRARTTTGLLLAALVTLSACGQLDDGAGLSAPTSQAPDAQTRAHMLRPTEDNPAIGLGYGELTPQSYASPGDHFKVWWVEEGEHRVRQGDSDGSGVPDFVERVAEVGDSVADYLTTNGWRLARSDEAYGALGKDDGGDDRFDIYLVNMTNGDGYMVTNTCERSPDSPSVSVCASHFVMENDFRGFNYPSPSYAAGVLVSHEYMHAVQNAYSADMPQWWSEGTATWFQEEFDPSQSDFERLANLYFKETDRSLTSRPQGPGDGFAYGASLFVFFLAKAYDSDLIRETFEGQAKGLDVLDALDAALATRGSSFDEAFRTFATWNAFTGLRGAEAPGLTYPGALRFDEITLPEVPLDGTRAFNWDVQIDAQATRYTRVRLGGKAMTAQLRAVGDAPSPGVIRLANPANYTRGEGLYELRLGDEPVRLEGIDEVFVIASNGTREDASARLAIRVAPAEQPDPEPDPDPDPGTDPDPVEEPDVVITSPKSDDGGCATPGPAGAPAGGWGGLLALGALLARRRRGARG